jgi:hypothetical protein
VLNIVNWVLLVLGVAACAYGIWLLVVMAGRSAGL